MITDSSDPLGLQAQVAGLHRRISRLEVQAFGEPLPEKCDATLHALYVDALLGNVDMTRTSAHLWSHVILNLTEEVLLVLGRSTSDPFPWRPLLLALDNLTVQGFNLDRATQHLLDVAKSLMKIQGLGMLKIGDVFGGLFRYRSAYQQGEGEQHDKKKEEGSEGV